MPQENSDWNVVVSPGDAVQGKLGTGGRAEQQCALKWVEEEETNQKQNLQLARRIGTNYGVKIETL